MLMYICSKVVHRFYIITGPVRMQNSKKTLLATDGNTETGNNLGESRYQNSIILNSSTGEVE